MTSVREFESALDCSEDAIVCTSLDGEVTSWNRAARLLYGYSADEVKGKSAVILAPPGKEDEIRSLIARAASGEAVHGVETYRRCKDTSTVPVAVSLSPVRDERGQIVGVAAAAREISEKLSANLRLKTQAAALEAAASAILITDAQGKIIWVNPAFTATTGYSKEEVLGKRPSVLKSGVQDEEFYQNLWSTISAGQMWQGEVVNRHKGGVFYTEEMTITPVCSDTGAVTHFVAVKQDITHRKAAEAALRHAEEGYRNVIENSILGIFQSATRGCFFCMNPAMASMLGYASPEQAIAEIANIRQQLWVDPCAYDEALKTLIAKGELLNHEAEIYRRDGKIQWLSFNVRCVYGLGHELMYFEGFVQNIEERKQLENQLQQAYKMDALGRLAGGVAHDFNNMLSIISGYGELLLALPELGENAKHYATEIRLASQRAASLTGQLLAFSRKQVVQPRRVDLNQIFRETGKMLQRLIGDDVALEIDLWPDEVVVRGDPGQLQQVIINLAVNSRDAMPRGGKLTMRTSVCHFDDRYAMLHQPMVAGQYAEITVEDTGCGMDKETLTHIFEPFFTTKENGRGTGLGLSIVYGIVKQTGGHTWVYSQPGQGTCFKLYLPAQMTAPEPAAAEETVYPLEGKETVLLVEDDAALRVLIAAYLEALGYTVLQARDGQEGVQISQNRQGCIELLVTDIMIPKLRGFDMVQQILATRPSTKIIYMSGYDGDNATFLMPENEFFLAKPFPLMQLAIKLRQAIDSGPQSLCSF